MNSLYFTDLPVHPNQMELDAIMRQVTEQLGDEWYGAYLEDTGQWALYHGHPGKVVPHFSRKSFIAALGDATGCTVINSISF